MWPCPAGRSSVIASAWMQDVLSKANEMAKYLSHVCGAKKLTHIGHHWTACLSISEISASLCLARPSCTFLILFVDMAESRALDEDEASLQQELHYSGPVKKCCVDITETLYWLPKVCHRGEWLASYVNHTVFTALVFSLPSHVTPE